MITEKHWKKPSPTRAAIPEPKRKGSAPECTNTGIRTVPIPENSRAAGAIVMSYLNGETKILEEILGFAVIVEGIVYGVYSSAVESDYIADSLRASGLTCEICRYE